MGWTVHKNKTVKEVVESITSTKRCLAYHFDPIELTLWTVWDYQSCGKAICVDLINPQLEGLAHYEPEVMAVKRFFESECPFWTNCPIEFLETVPVSCQKWRNWVIESNVRLQVN